MLIVFGAWLFLLDRRPALKLEKRWQFNSAQVVLAAFSIAALGVLISAIPYGLLGQPDMGLINGYGGLPWFMDRTAAALPGGGSCCRSGSTLAMLLWALWLSFALLRWLPWAWRRYASEGCGARIAPLRFRRSPRARAALSAQRVCRCGPLCGLVSGALADEQVTSLPSETPATFTPTNADFDYVKREEMVPMRDGVKLFISSSRRARRTRRCC